MIRSEAAADMGIFSVSEILENLHCGYELRASLTLRIARLGWGSLIVRYIGFYSITGVILYK